MPIFPFFQYPYINRYYQKSIYNKHINNELNNENSINASDKLSNNIETNNIDNFTSDNCDNISLNKNKSSRYTGFGLIHFQSPFSMNNEEPIIEILGISLYLDDIIILGLLFFLYQEGVKDYMLYLVLILLLLN